MGGINAWKVPIGLDEDSTPGRRSAIGNGTTGNDEEEEGRGLVVVRGESQLSPIATYRGHPG